MCSSTGNLGCDVVALQFYACKILAIYGTETFSNFGLMNLACISLNELCLSTHLPFFTAPAKTSDVKIISFCNKIISFNMI